MTRTLSILSEIRALSPPAGIEDSRAGDSKVVRYPPEDAPLGREPVEGENLLAGAATLSVATDPGLARGHGRYLVNFEMPVAAHMRGIDYAASDPAGAITLYGLYKGDETRWAAEAFRAAAWMLGAPYRNHDGAQYGVPAAEIAQLPFPAVVALDQAVRAGLDVRSMVHDKVEPWGKHVRWLLISVFAPSYEHLEILAAGLGVPVRLLGDPEDRFGIFALNRAER